MMEPEEIIQEVKLKLDEVQSACLEWKGRAISMGPALKVALAAIKQIEWVMRPSGSSARYVCPWCVQKPVSVRGVGVVAHFEDQTEHAPDCERQIAIKILEEAIKR